MIAARLQPLPNRAMLDGESVRPCTSRAAHTGFATVNLEGAVPVAFQSRGTGLALPIVAIGGESLFRSELVLDLYAHFVEDPLLAGQIVVEREPRSHVRRVHFRRRHEAVPGFRSGMRDRALTAAPTTMVTATRATRATKRRTHLETNRMAGWRGAA